MITFSPKGWAGSVKSFSSKSIDLAVITWTMKGDESAAIGLEEFGAEAFESIGNVGAVVRPSNPDRVN